MPTVEIYTWRACPFCIRAKSLLDRKGVTYTEYAIDGDQAARQAMSEKRRRAGAPVFPRPLLMVSTWVVAMTSTPWSAAVSSMPCWEPELECAH